MVVWKSTKNAWRVRILIQDEDDDDFIVEEDILDSELNPDTMTDFYSFYNWFSDEWEVLSVKPIQLNEWKEMIVKNKWRGWDTWFGQYFFL
jgi:hypothetical protein